MLTGHQVISEKNRLIKSFTCYSWIAVECKEMTLTQHCLVSNTGLIKKITCECGAVLQTFNNVNALSLWWVFVGVIGGCEESSLCFFHPRSTLSCWLNPWVVFHWNIAAKDIRNQTSGTAWQQRMTKYCVCLSLSHWSPWSNIWTSTETTPPLL